VDDEVVIRAFQVANWNRMMAPTARKWSDEEVERRLKAVPREPFSEAEIAHAVANIRRTLERMETDLSRDPWLAGDAFSLADIHLSPYIVRIDEHAERGIRLGDYPRCADWWQRLTARPAFPRARIEAVVFKDS
jgi:glutathione S-transferase